MYTYSAVAREVTVTYLLEAEVEGVGRQVGVVEEVGLVDHQEQGAEEGEVELHPQAWEVGAEREGEQGLMGLVQLTPVQ